MLIRTWRLDDIVVVEASGRLGVESGSALSDAAGEAIGMGCDRLVVNILEVSRIDAWGVGELVRSFRVVCAAAGEMKLVVRAPAVRDVLARTRVLALFPIYDTEAAAFASFEIVPSCRSI